MNRRDVLLASGASAVAAAARARVANKLRLPVSPALRRQLDAIARAEKLSGSAVAIARGGRLIGWWAHGFASLPFRVPVTSETLFAVASVAKHATATGVLKLLDEGRVRLDASIRTYLPLVPAEWADRTVRMLLTHTSGLPDFTLGQKLAEDADDPTRAQMIARMQFREPLFAAGEGWSYSNSNYLLLGWLIEDRLGKPFAQALPEWVLRPAGAPHARADGPGVVTPRLAEPYVFDSRYWRVPFRQTDVADGSGSLQWSVEDIAPWGDALLGGRVASLTSMQQASDWSRLRSGQEIPYGFGFFLDRVAGRAVRWHNGGAPGTVGMLLQLPAEDLTVAVMSNTDTPGRVMRSMGWQAAHSVAPHATFLGRPKLPADPLDARVAALGASPRRLEPDRSFVAPDFARVLDDATEQRRFAPGFSAEAVIEAVGEYRRGGLRMRRYRVTEHDHVDHRLAGFDEQGRLFWLWGC